MPSTADPGVRGSRPPAADWRHLAGALMWRARREGISAIFGYPFGLLCFIVLVTTASLWHDDGAAATMAVAGPYGVLTHGVGMSVAVLGVPGLLIMGLSIGGGRCVESLIGSEASTGGFEILLAHGFRPRDLARATIGVVAAAIGVLWIALTAACAVLLGVLDALTHARLRLTVSYVAMTLLLPAVVAIAGAFLAIALGFVSPTLTQPAQRGIAGGTGAIIGTVAVFPGLLMTLVALLLAGHLDAVAVLGIGVLLALVLAAATFRLIRRRFGYEGMLRST